MMLSDLRHITNTIPTPAGRLCSKLQDFTGTGNVYAYSPNSKQHAVRRIYNGLTNELYNLRWDNNGNLAQQTVYSVNNNVPTYLNMRMLFWDEDDRLNLVAGDGYLSYYTYGHDGNRAIKMTGNATIDQNGVLQNTSDLNNITIYPNEYLTVTQAEYTKYYYAGRNRIASKIGTGGFGKMQRLCTQDLNLNANANALFSNILQQVVNTTNQPNDEYPVNTCGGYNIATELLTSPLPDFYISQTNLNFTQNNLLQQFRQNLAGGTEAVYYFHSDHLGSASWITDGTGAAVQHLLYLPFGEHFVNEHSSGYDERFTFTGKERDAETGYYYHGARFNCSDIGWLSVDPMSDKYPSISPYAYCAWNPVKLVDPSGEDFEKIIDHEKKTITIQAQFYVSGTATEEQERFFQKALDAWNSCSAVVSIPIGETGETEDYTICFNLINNKEKVVAPVNSVTFIPDNIFVKNFPKNPDAGGGTPSGNRIYMRNSSINNQLLAHEIGHCLGMTDHGITEYGLMFGTNSNLGNVRVASLGCVELGRLLYSCGFNFKGLEKKTDERIGRCVNTITYGNAPIGFENAVLSDRNIIKTDTKKFIR